jgi:hypothetical protein
MSGVVTQPAQHSTAQHSTAQHSTAQHSTAQHSTAHHPRPALGFGLFHSTDASSKTGCSSSPPPPDTERELFRESNYFIRVKQCAVCAGRRPHSGYHWLASSFRKRLKRTGWPWRLIWVCFRDGFAQLLDSAVSPKPRLGPIVIIIDGQ